METLYFIFCIIAIFSFVAMVSYVTYLIRGYQINHKNQRETLKDFLRMFGALYIEEVWVDSFKHLAKSQVAKEIAETTCKNFSTEIRILIEGPNLRRITFPPGNEDIKKLFSSIVQILEGLHKKRSLSIEQLKEEFQSQLEEAITKIL